MTTKCCRVDIVVKLIAPRIPVTRNSHVPETVIEHLSLSIFAAGSLLLSACSNSRSGEYVGESGSFLDKIVFKSGDKVEVIKGGGTRVGTYQVDGKQVTTTIGNDQETMIIDDKGCIGSGNLRGTSCKA